MQNLFKPVSRAKYFAIGVSLMLLKYLVEYVAIYFSTGLHYSPLVFLSPLQTTRMPYMKSEWMGWVWVVWSVPFLFFAICYSIRRCIDAKLPASYGCLVVIPLFNFVVMFFLSTVGKGRDPLDGKSRSPQAKQLQADMEHESLGFTISMLAGVLGGTIFMVAATILSVYLIGSYGAALFLGMPFVAGVVSGLVGYQLGLTSRSAAVGIGSLSVILGGSCLLLFALEGVICLVMAAPLVIPLGAVGGLFGYLIGENTIRERRDMYLSCFIGIVPLIAMVEQRSFEPPTQVVTSEIVIDASPEEVWAIVVAFPEIKKPPTGLFSFGVSYPIRARIEGEGKSAIRYCEFNTGSFVEPITTWDAPRHLAFDVIEQPSPMKEMTPYRDIHPPHLRTAFQSERGEFVLEELPDGRTRLIGRTWYYVDMGPQVYWSQWTDWIIHKIHMRVLSHIKEVAEVKDEAETQ